MAARTAARRKATSHSFLGGAPVSSASTRTTAKDKRHVDIDGLETHASLVAVAKALEPLLKTSKAHIDAQTENALFEDGLAKGRRPDNIKGKEGAANASLELRKKSSAWPLKEAAIELLTQNGISMEVKTKYELNTELLTPEVAAKVEIALNSVPGIPTNLITKVEDTYVSEASLEELFALDEKSAREVLPVVATLAIKPTIAEDFSTTLDRVVAILNSGSGTIQ